MSDPYGRHGPPKLALRACFALAVLSLILAAFGRDLGIALVDERKGEPVSSRFLYFHDLPDGRLEVLDAAKNVVLARYAAGEQGFMRGVMRALSRGRKTAGVGAEEPFELARLADGRLWLIDPVTDQRIDLIAFGRDNLAVFVDLASRDSSQERLASHRAGE